jgi:hypothetical protein
MECSESCRNQATSVSISSQNKQLWPSWFLRSRCSPFLFEDCCVNPEKWEFGKSVESITVKAGNICKVTHTHTLPMNAPPPTLPTHYPVSHPAHTHTETQTRAHTCDRKKKSRRSLPSFVRSVSAKTRRNTCRSHSAILRTTRLCMFGEGFLVLGFRPVF